MRAKAYSLALNRKEEYLGARVPKELKEKVISRAADLGLPVSILIRQLLEHAFAGDTELPQAAGANLAGTAAKAEVNKFPAILAWERIKLNREMHCEQCGVNIQAGASATLGFSLEGDQRVILCDLCSESL